MIAGRKHYYRFGAEGVAEARRHFEQALSLDPDYGTAISWLGWTHWYDARFGPSSHMQSSLELAERQVARLEPFENRNSLVGTLEAAIYLLKGKHEEADS